MPLAIAGGIAGKRLSACSVEEEIEEDGAASAPEGPKPSAAHSPIAARVAALKESTNPVMSTVLCTGGSSASH